MSDSPERVTTALSVFDELGGQVLSIEGLQFHRASRTAFQKLTVPSVTDGYYEVRWEVEPGVESVGALPDGEWLIFADEGGVGAALAERLRGAGKACTLFSPRDDFQQIGLNHYGVNPADAEQIRGALKQASDPQQELAGVVHLWNLDIGGRIDRPDDPNPTDPEVHRDCRGILHLVQAFLQSDVRQPRQLLLVSQNAAAGDVRDGGLSQSLTWGLGRVVQQEHPGLGCRLIDLPGQEIGETVEQLLDEMESTDGLLQVAYREGQRRTPRLAPCDRPRSDPPRLDEDRTYLITGGLGDLGLVLAQRLVDQGARNLMLVGRRAPDTSTAQKLQEWQSAGIRVEVRQADVGVRSDVARLLAEIGEQMPRLSGIFHCAGVLSDGVLANQRWEQFEEVLSGKAWGAWHLHTLSDDMELDHFVVYSSATSLLGTPGQSNYASANAFLDALCDYRRVRGLAGLSINWGAWGEVGMAAEGNSPLTSAMGGGIRPDRGSQIVGELLGWEGSQVAVLPGGSTQSVGAASDQGVRLWELLPRFTGQDNTAAREAFEARLTSVASNQRRDLLQQLVTEQVAGVLAVPDTARLNPQQPLTEAGMDSLMAVELTKALTAITGLTLSPTLLFDYPTIEHLAGYLATRILKSTQDRGKRSADRARSDSNRDEDNVEEAPVDLLDDMSAGELEQLLANKIRDIQQRSDDSAVAGS